MKESPANMNQSQDQETVEKEESQVKAYVFVPGLDFFTEKINLPAGLSGNDLGDAISTQLEIITPFHEEQLSWGVYFNETPESVLVFARLKKELELGEEQEHALQTTPCFPSFLPFIGFVAEAPSILCGVNGSSISLLVFDRAGELPVEVHSILLESAEITDELVAKVCADMLRELPWVDLPILEQIYHFETVEENWKHDLSFHSKTSSGGVISLELPGKQNYFADIREETVKRKFLSNARLNSWLWLGTMGAIAAILVLSLFSLGLWGWNQQITGLERKVVDQQLKVDSIEAKSRNLLAFESGSAARLQPLAMLDIMNRYRPDGIFFSEIMAFEGKRMQIEGAAEKNGTSLVNDFKSKLDQLDALKNTSIEITRISQGATFFQINVEFNDLELANVGAHH